MSTVNKCLSPPFPLDPLQSAGSKPTLLLAEEAGV